MAVFRVTFSIQVKKCSPLLIVARQPLPNLDEAVLQKVLGSLAIMDDCQEQTVECCRIPLINLREELFIPLLQLLACKRQRCDLLFL